MGEKKEYDYDKYYSLKQQRNSKYNEIISYQNENQSIEQKIERLIAAKEIVVSEKDSFKVTKKSSKDTINDTYEWKGKLYDQFKSLGETLEQDNNDYYNSIDDVLDSINNEITNLENQIYYNNGFIGQLQAAWNSLCNQIENFFN